MTHTHTHTHTGIPEWLGRLADTLHEGLPEGEYQKWPERFIKAIPVELSSKDLDKKVKAPFFVIVLHFALETFDHKKYPDVKGAIEQSIALWRREDIGSEEFVGAAWAAAEAAESFGDAWLAEFVVGSAASAAMAATGDAGNAWLAESAVWAAMAAWGAGDPQAPRAASDSIYKYFSDELVRLLEEAQD